MYALSTLASLNARAARLARFETETTRHCSFQVSKSGIVLHSAKLRSTCFLEDGAATKAFLAKYWGTNSQDRRDALVESYFAS